MKIFKIKSKPNGDKCYYFFGVKLWRRKKTYLYLQKKIDALYADIDTLCKAIGDMNGVGYLSLLLRNAKVAPLHNVVFQKMREGDVCIDGGANVGVFTDICKHQGALVYAFEPSVDTFKILEKKYRNDNNVKLYQKAIWVDDCELEFFHQSSEDENFSDKSQWATLIKYTTDVGDKQVSKEKVQAIDFCRFLEEEILRQHKEIYVLKLDIEGSEFEVLKQMIDKNLYKNIKYIFVETHERFFADGEQKMEDLQNLIQQKNITNIYLDWV